METMKLNLAAMANELGHTMQDALSDTGMFQDMLDKSFDRLSLIDDEGLSLEDTMGILRDLVRESRTCACLPCTFATSSAAPRRRSGAA